MSKNIKIIKRSERHATGKAGGAKSRAANNPNTGQATRDIAGHVTTWIKEFQQRHTPDPRRAFASLFIDPATSSPD